MQLSQDKAVVVLSGGQDSTTCLLWARGMYKEVHAITFDYGQKHRAELHAAVKVAEVIGVDSHRIVQARGLLHSTSPLLDPAATLETYSDFESMDKIIGNRVELTFVPMRNTFFLTLAANHAVSLGCARLVTGVCAMDNANYPDCTSAFIALMEATINQSLGIYTFKIDTPLIQLTKERTVHLALSYKDGYEALSYTHTCYAGEVPPCGKCHACVLRAEGFRLAGKADPLIERTGAAAATGSL